MKITFFSNFLNHHQLYFCNEMIKILGDDFKFVATQTIPNDRKLLGYEDMNKKYDFVVRAYEDEKIAYNLALNSDVVIIGSASNKYIKNRLKQKKLVFRYSERVFKKGFRLKTFLSLLLKRTLIERNNTYLLCASAYAANDFNIAYAYKNKTYKWGYFPETKEYSNIDDIIGRKKKNSILWVGRFLEWKHPEVVIEIAKKLKDDKYEFIINMIGIGEIYYQINDLIIKNNLEKNVKLLGSMNPSEVRKYMEESQIFLFTSDKGEGWGAVLNEAMNSACAVIASHEIGSVPFLIKNGENGIIYENGETYDLYNKVRKILNNDKYLKCIEKKAYNTIIDLWNSKIAANRLVEMSKCLLKSEEFDKYKDGPCSKAYKLKDNWYRSNRGELDVKKNKKQ